MAEYKMSINLNVINHLGIGLYSSIPAVLSELVANAWDADATFVEISIEPELDRVTITDNGVGMTNEDINKKFLNVGYQKRRHEGASTAGGRHVMGRKGIGKLSVFAISRLVEIHTRKGSELNGFRMDREAIKRHIEEGGQIEYHPEALSNPDFSGEHGTRIVLVEFDKSLAGGVQLLRRRLARRFSVIGPRHKFEVKVNESAISPQDRDYFSKLEFVWHLGEGGADVDPGKIVESFVLSGVVGTWQPKIHSESRELRVTGWIGTVDRPESIEEVNNAVVVMAHGKLIHENILAEFGEAGVYADYVVGEVNADFLDLDEFADIITSDRQSVKEDDRRFELLRSYLLGVLRDIKSRWTDLRLKRGADRALEVPVLRAWYERLGPDHRRVAERLFGKIESLRLTDKNARRELYKASLLAFEKLALQNTLSRIDRLGPEELRALTVLFREVDDLEAVHYYQIAKGRIEVVREFSDLLPEAKERVVQQYIFDHLWLLNPTWERAATNARIEESVTKEFAGVTASLSKEERTGRIDVRYRTAGGKHIIIELKRYEREVSAEELVRQIRRYKSALLKCLKEKFPDEPRAVECICVLGSAPNPKDQEDDNRRLLNVVGARWVTYDALITETLRGYEEYMAGERRVSTLVSLLERLDSSFDEVNF